MRLSTEDHKPAIQATQLVAGVFLLSMGSLLCELALTRIFSVIMWYHFAFLAISLALVGLSAGSILTFLWPAVPQHVGRRLVGLALIASLAIVIGLQVMLRMQMTEQIDLGMFLRIAVVCVVSAFPFVCIGAGMASAIRYAGARVSVVYGADLLGAAMGCLLFVPLIDWIGGPLTIVAAAVVSAGAAMVFAPRGRLRILAAVVVAGLILLAEPLRQSGRLEIAFAKGHERHDIEVRWNSFSRVAAWKHESTESFTTGISDTFVRPITLPHLVIDIDAGANTPVLAEPQSPADLEFLRYDLTALPFTVVQPRHTLVIGPGGGRDVVLSLEHGAERVAAVEINPDVADLAANRFAPFSGDLFRKPGVELIVRDGRSFIEHDPGQYDVIMLSLVDTFAASAAGAMSLTENLLYTREAFDAYLSKLKPQGVLAITRWVWKPDRETLRIVSLARGALSNLGVADPSRHILAARQKNLGCVVISRDPLTDEQVNRASEWIARMQFIPLYVPGESHPGEVEQLVTTASPEAFYAAYPFDVRPPTDRRPFFFFTLRLRDVLKVLSMPEGRAQNLGVLIVIVAAAVVTVMTLLFVFLPLWLRRGDAVLREGRIPLLPFSLYFLALGAGFMLLEIPLLQSLVLLLAHPSLALSVAVFSLLLGAGLGSIQTRHWADRNPVPRLVVSGVCMAILTGIFILVAPILFSRFGNLPTPARSLLASAMVLPIGFCLGMFLPVGLKQVGEANTFAVPWALGLNAIASVLGSVLAIGISIVAGFVAALGTGIAVYGIALAAFMMLRSQLKRLQVAEGGHLDALRNAGGV